MMSDLLNGIERRLRRMWRRRKVGKAYDMALEVARVIPSRARVLDVGCGNGFIAHHLNGIGASVIGLDVSESTDAKIHYLRYDGRHFPVQSDAFDAVLLCYVLHHAQNFQLVMNEVRRVLTFGGRAIIYEDIPLKGWDRILCWTHDRQWRHRTGPCTFQLQHEWRALFRLSGFEVINERQLSRWRNLAHPVSRRLYVLTADDANRTANPNLRPESTAPAVHAQVCAAV